MAKLHQLTHPDKIIEKKVNYFADYYDYITKEISTSDFLELENPLSLIEKIIFQIENNFEKCLPYLDSYLNNSLFNKKDKYFKEYKTYEEISPVFEAYKKLNKKSKRDYVSNKEFLVSAKKFRTYLKRYMFRGALKTVINYLSCKHELKEHEKDLRHYTRIIVSEFLLNNFAVNDIQSVFSKIIKQSNQKGFKNQFEGIYRYFNEKFKTEYFIYRIFGIRTVETFKFKYDKVTFCSPDHDSIKSSLRKIKKEKHFTFFTDSYDMILAFVKIKYNSLDAAKVKAASLIRKELVFLNYKCNSQSTLNTQSYLSTKDFVKYNYSISGLHSYTIGKQELSRLNDNPYRFLKGTNNLARKHFLSFEHIFITGLRDSNIVDLWSYLESLIPLDAGGKKQVKDVVSSLLVLDTFNNEKRIIDWYIRNAISTFNTCADTIGLTSEQQKQFCHVFWGNHDLNYNKFKKEVRHSFLEYLILKSENLIEINYEAKLEYFKRNLLDMYSQRNLIIHNGFPNDKAMLAVYNTSWVLIDRFRKVIFNGMRANRDVNFKELLQILMKEAEELLNQNNHA